MNGRFPIAALGLAALALSACEREAQRANANLCADFKAPAANQAAPAATVADAASPVDECVKRWAYSLAPSRDEAETVAEAAVAACSGPLSRWNQQALGQSAGDGGGPVEAISIRTGLPTNALTEHNVFAHDRALLYVVQARAGRCAPPPASKGVPSGLPG